MAMGSFDFWTILEEFMASLLRNPSIRTPRWCVKALKGKLPCSERSLKVRGSSYRRSASGSDEPARAGQHCVHLQQRTGKS